MRKLRVAPLTGLGVAAPLSQRFALG